MENNPYQTPVSDIQHKEAYMKLQYDLKFKDYFLYNMWHQLQSIPTQLFNISLVFFVTYAQFIERGVLVGSIVFLIAYILLWFFLQILNLAFLISTKNKSILTVHEVEIQEDSFVESTKYNKSFHYWPGIVKISTFPGVVAVYISAHGAHIIPNRAFVSPDHKSEFVKAINDKTTGA